MGALRIEDLPHYTYEDYKIWEGRWEIIDGIAYAMAPSPIFGHQNISANISYELKNSLKKCKQCKSVIALDWIITDNTVVCPDNAVVCSEMTSDFIKKAPQIIFEILSPSTKNIDKNRKYNLFQEYGVQYYIIVDPKGNYAEIYKLKNKLYEIQGEYSNEKFNFELDDCCINFNFANIFDQE